MVQHPDRSFRVFYLLVFLLALAVIVLRAYHIPFVHDEITTFFFYVQNSDFLPYKSHAYTNNHVLNSLLTTICYKLWGSHPFVLRIPNIIAFIVLAAGVYRFFRYATGIPSRLVMMAFFLLTFGFLDFFELCRGYGLSLGAIVLGLSYLQDYFATPRLRPLLLFSVWWQLALAANLTLLIPFTLLLVFVLLYQVLRRHFLSLPNLLLLAANFFLLSYWIRFALFYKEKGLLDSGAPEHYWKTTFVTLIKLMFGSDHVALQFAVVALVLLAAVLALRVLLRGEWSWEKLFQPEVFYSLLFTLLVLAFFLQRMMLGINYPEDRTALFFYCFFAPAVALSLNVLNSKGGWAVAGAIFAGSVISFVLAFNLTTFTSLAYAVMPRSFHDYMAQQQASAGAPLTLGGHRTRELNFTFANYRQGSPVNPMVVSEEMHMNTDYCYASLLERPYYRFFYDEVIYDEWDCALLKRKYPISRRYLPDQEKTGVQFPETREFYDFLAMGDTAVPPGSSVEADLEINFGQLPSPFKAFIVFQVNDTTGQMLQYKRIDLTHLGDDLSGQTRRFRMASEPLQAGYGKVAVYLWNIDSKPATFTLNHIRFAVLKGKGVNLSVPPEYYRMFP